MKNQPLNLKCVPASESPPNRNSLLPIAVRVWQRLGAGMFPRTFGYSHLNTNLICYFFHIYEQSHLSLRVSAPGIFCRYSTGRFHLTSNCCDWFNLKIGLQLTLFDYWNIVQ